MSNHYSVVRANPKNLARPGSGGSMQAAFVNGDQQAPVRDKKIRLRNRRRRLNQTEAGDFWPAEPLFIEQSNSVLHLSPANRLVARGSSVTLTLNDAKAYDVEWRCYSPVEDDEQIVTDNGKRIISDTPVYDTVYEVRFKTIGEKYHSRVGGPAMYVRGHRIAAYFTVIDNPEEPSSCLRCSLEQTLVNEGVASYLFCVENTSRETALKEVLLAIDTDIESYYVEKEARRVLQKSCSQQRTCSNWIEETSPVGAFVACKIDALGPGEKCFACYAAAPDIEQTKQEIKGAPKITRASVWSNFEMSAVAPVGCKNLFVS